MAGLGDMFGASMATVNGKSPRNSDRIQAGQPLNLRGAFEAAQNIPVAGDILSGVMAAYDAAKGDYPSAAMNAVGVLPFVSGTFIGKGAKTWDALKAADAEKRIAAGDDVRKVWKETGTFKGPDGHLRQEIDDSDASLLKNKLQTVEIDGKNYESFPIRSALNHPELYKSYDSVGEIGGSFRTNGSNGAQYNGAIDSISFDRAHRIGIPSDSQREAASNAYSDLSKYVSSPRVRRVDRITEGLLDNEAEFDRVFNRLGGPAIEAERSRLAGKSYSTAQDLLQNPAGGARLGGDNSKSVTLHEIQHAIQGREGWAKGGSPDNAMGADILPKLDDIRAQKKALGIDPYVIGNRRSSGYHVAQEDLDKLAQYEKLTALEDHVLSNRLSPFESYQRLAGEAEARATQARMNMNMEQRLNTYPLDSYDVPVDQLIIRGNTPLGAAFVGK